MTEVMKKKTKKRLLLGFFIILTALICSSAQMYETDVSAKELEQSKAEDSKELEQSKTEDSKEPIEPEEPPVDTAIFQILATGDLHGQATAYNYETDKAYEMFGLSKIASLISSARKKLGTSNTLLVDAGDFLYDFSTNYFYNNEPDTIQPIMQMMAALKYDCITLGNHEFDYPWDYLTEQLKRSGLWNKTIISNMFYEETLENIFAPSAVFTKEVETANGDIIDVKVGIIGATREALSTRRQYYGFLKGQDIYQCVKKEAERLKKKENVDLVIAVIHGGIGVLSGSNTSTHPGGRLAKLSAIDGVVTSHSHEIFPAKDGTYSSSAYTSIVDESKGLVYGKPVVGCGSHGYGLGILQFNLAIDKDGNIEIESASSEVRQVTEKTSERLSLVNSFSKYLPNIQNSIDTTKYKIADDLIYTNLDCFIQDSNLFQLYNNAKLTYANSYIAQYLKEYSKLPVIACTANILDDKSSSLTITKNFTSKKISSLISETSIARDSGYIHMYKITGAKLKEWLEFNASIYSTAGTDLKKMMPNYSSKHPEAFSLLQDAYLDSRTDFYVFDGISYEVDISKPPRYNSNGKVIDWGAHRIQNLTYQGKKVTDKQEFIIIMDSLAKRYSFMPEDSESIFTKLPWKNGKDIFLEYLEELSRSGPINVKADNNWKLIIPQKYRFVVGMPYNTSKYFQNQNWFIEYAAIYDKSTNFPVYYLGSSKQLAKLKQSLNVTLSANNLIDTSLPITIKVFATHAADVTISEIKYLPGKITSTKDSAWKNAAVINGTNFSVTKNGTYTVLVIDSNGKKDLETITISNYFPDIVDTPILSTSFNNRITTIRGTASPKTTVIAKVPNGTLYSAVSDSKGAFVIEVPYQRAFDIIEVWATIGDSVSETVELQVKKTGANVPTMDKILPGQQTAYGTTDPNTIVYFRVNTTIYINSKNVDRYLASDFYKDTYTIVETDISIKKDNTFKVVFPKQWKTGVSIWVYALDMSNRSSKGFRVIVGEDDPTIDPDDTKDDTIGDDIDLSEESKDEMDDGANFDGTEESEPLEPEIDNTANSSDDLDMNIDSTETNVNSTEEETSNVDTNSSPERNSNTNIDSSLEENSNADTNSSLEQSDNTATNSVPEQFSNTNTDSSLE